MSSMLITLLLVAGVGVAIWKRCDIFPDMCNPVNPTANVKGLTPVTEANSPNGGAFKPGDPTPQNPVKDPAKDALLAGKDFKAQAQQEIAAAIAKGKTTSKCTGSYMYKPNVGLVDTGCGKPASSVASKYTSARFSRISI